MTSPNSFEGLLELDGLLTKVRAALPAALERLESIAKNSEDKGVAVRASLGL